MFDWDSETILTNTVEEICDARNYQLAQIWKEVKYKHGG